MKGKIGAVFFVFSLCVSVSASAQPCPGYAQVDAQAIKTVFTTVQSYLARQKELSYLTSFGAPIVSLGLLTQRAALANEYEAERLEIENLASNPGVALRPRSARFVFRVLSNLGLQNTTLLGSTQAAAEANSQAANTAVTNALGQLWRCY